MKLEKIAVKNERPGTLPVPGLRPPDDGDLFVPSEDSSSISIEKIAVKNERPGTLPVPALRPPDVGDLLVPSDDTSA